MDAFDLATAIGTFVGSVSASWMAARTASRRDRVDSSSLLRKVNDGAQERTRMLSVLTKSSDVQQQLQRQVEKLEAEISQLRVARYVTAEEFQVYTRMDSERRERLITGLAELKGRLRGMEKDT